MVLLLSHWPQHKRYKIGKKYLEFVPRESILSIFFKCLRFIIKMKYHTGAMAISISCGLPIHPAATIHSITLIGLYTWLVKFDPARILNVAVHYSTFPYELACIPDFQNWTETWATGLQLQFNQLKGHWSNVSQGPSHTVGGVSVEN